ncbi:MAG: non-canonical purine NTP pyrophosphatase [SAR86 cluster bacterium]|nr:non-canonical purine NTP pyrophosphatase [SAR86 cluster bacterium]
MKRNKEILLASSNKGKIAEFQKIFVNKNLVSLSDLGIGDAIEDGLSFLENAIKKARHGAKYSGLYSIADDSGLVVPDLNFEPGIYSARYAGSDSTDELNREKLISSIKGSGKDSLDAYYVCIIVGMFNESDPMPIFASGKIHGKVSIYESGEGGFGYDRLFYPRGYSSSMASIESDVKNKISHRGLAASDFINKFNSIEPV